MAERPAAVHIAENSPEQVALKMTDIILRQIPNKSWEETDKETFLTTYRECLAAIHNPSNPVPLSKPKRSQ